MDRKLTFKKKRYNRINLSNNVRTTGDMGKLIPIYCNEALPGDHFKIRNELDLKFLPLVAPVMHEVEVCIDWFYGEDRVLWGAEFEKFIAGHSATAVPEIDIGPTSGYQAEVGSVGHYMGLPDSNVIIGDESLYAPPFNLYFKAFDDWYRNPHFQSEAAVDLVPGANNTLSDQVTDKDELRHVLWQKDQFTSALPAPQEGTEILIPLLNTTSGAATVTTVTGLGVTGNIRKSSDDTIVSTTQGLRHGGSGAMQSDDATNVYYDPNGTQEVQLNNIAGSIRDLRRNAALQKWAERGMRGGAERHVEYLATYWGLKSRDLRLDRTHFIGTTYKSPVRFSEIRSTAETRQHDSNTIDSPLGVLSGYGRSIGGSKQLNFTAPDHGWIMGLLYVRPKTAYSQGIDKKFQKTSRFDWYWDDLANIGEVAVKNKEIWAGAALQSDRDDTWGYMPQYYEYMFQKDLITGQFDHNASLEHWHLGRDLTTPVLNSTFVLCNPSKRIFADTTAANHTMVIQCINHVIAARQVAKLGVPSL